MQFMKDLKKIIKELQKNIVNALAKAQTESELEQVRLDYLTRQGALAQLMARLKAMTPEEKRVFGPLLNNLRQQVFEQLEVRKEELKRSYYELEQKKKSSFDVTAYSSGRLTGSLHPYTYLVQKIEDVFISMGYAIAEGPELENEFMNFEALNIPADHPARDMQDTLWLELPGKLMRTHTSNVQIRTMLSQKPPFAVLSPGRCYRYEATDATHDYVFMQTEGLLVSENISMSNLFATTKVFLSSLFEKKNIEIRMRPSYFPFVEPGVEIDMQCIFCKKGCSVCKGSRWIEVVGAGLVHPNVLKACKVNSDKYSGFAFGFGLTRLAMLKYGINDIRLLSSGSLDFLTQF